MDVLPLKHPEAATLRPENTPSILIKIMERRPNPPGWVPPKAPYNPYDPTDLRPAEGYPSEFKTPGKPRNWTQIPREATQHREMQETLRRLNYTPRPASELYPGQFKVLKRRKGSSYSDGVRFFGKVTTFVVLIGAVFFVRWNDGYDNVFSGPYRLQLRIRQKLFGNLSPQQIDDLEGKQRGMIKKLPTPGQTKQASAELDASTALERPQRSHVIEAERRMQERQEALLRAVQIAEEKVAQKNSSEKKSTWKWWK